MKNKIFINAWFICGLFLVSIIGVKAQSESITFKTGIRLATKTEAITIDSQRLSIKPFLKYETKDNKVIVHRILSDFKNNLYFGYDLEISQSSQPDKFNVEIKPLSYSPTLTEIPDIDKFTARQLPNYPAAMTVGNGDIITLEILQDPKTKAKITDYLKVTDSQNPYGDSFSELNPTKDFSLDDINLNLESFEIFINGEIAGKMGGGVSGPNVYFTVPNRGRIVVSPFPREGFKLQKIGKIIDNKLTFKIGADKYEIVSKSPILGNGGNWNAWVMHDPAFQKTYVNPKSPDSIQVGAGDLQFFFKKSVLSNLEK